MCRALGVSPRGFYAAQRRAPSARAQADEQLRVEVRAAHAKSRRRYGAPRVHQELRAEGTRMAKKRVARLMREDGLVARSATDIGRIKSKLYQGDFSLAIRPPTRIAPPAWRAGRGGACLYAMMCRSIESKKFARPSSSRMHLESSKGSLPSYQITPTSVVM